MDPLTLAIIAVACALIDLAQAHPPKTECTVKREGVVAKHDNESWRCTDEAWKNVDFDEVAE